MRLHLHANLVSGFIIFLQFLMAWIPIKFLASKFEARSPLAAAVLNVL